MTVFDDLARLDAQVRGLLEDWRGDVEGEPLAPVLDVPAMCRSWLARRDRDRSRAEG
ncbi:hypothetical protein ACFXPA_24435 [Amycolatopsis sp. NPDC059090]|uniref:hypothetical protein n=1 Tax=unclassified Amycolatopsis TaxID=2618356 RepID=UPI003671E316